MMLGTCSLKIKNTHTSNTIHEKKKKEERGEENK